MFLSAVAFILHYAFYQFVFNMIELRLLLIVSSQQLRDFLHIAGNGLCWSPVNDIKGRESRSAVYRCIIMSFCPNYIFFPSLRFFVNECSEILLQTTIEHFGLAVRLRMVGRAHL